MTRKRVLVVYYTFTQQTRTQLMRFIDGLKDSGVEVTLERLPTFAPYDYPFKTIFHLVVAMIVTFFQRRIAIQPIAAHCRDHWDCIILAGPTWSYNPSGPVLDFLDRYGKEVCAGKTVVPFISCRAYWRPHYWIVRRRLQQLVGWGDAGTPTNQAKASGEVRLEFLSHSNLRGWKQVSEQNSAMEFQSI